MIDQYALIQVFKDTQRIIRENGELSERTLKMQAGTQLYLRGYDSVKPTVKRENPEILVVEDTTFHCAQSYVNGEDKVAVLNFANAYSPGGGVVNGEMAQEECLCRSSNLYPALTLPYLHKNYYKWNSNNTGDMGTDAVIYSPGVTVFKTDDAIPVIMEKAKWFQVDVLTCAAPYVRTDKKRSVTREKLEDVHDKRMKNILEVASANNVDILILGAFGSGAFNNPPDLVAEVCRHLLIQDGYGRFFKKVVFAIKKNNAQNTNLEAFKIAFE